MTTKIVKLYLYNNKLWHICPIAHNLPLRCIYKQTKNYHMCVLCSIKIPSFLFLGIEDNWENCMYGVPEGAKELNITGEFCNVNSN